MNKLKLLTLVFGIILLSVYLIGILGYWSFLNLLQMEGFDIFNLPIFIFSVVMSLMVTSLIVFLGDGK